MDEDRWLTSPRPVEDPRCRLFCFPYAGGSATIFKPWIELLPPSIEIQVLQLPGRPGRMNEAPVDEIEPIVEAAAEAIEPLTDVPYAFYGHSMGSLVAYEVTRKLWDEYRHGPSHLFVAARRAPHMISRNQTIHAEPEMKVRNFLKGLRVVPAEVLDNDELMALLLPALRADLKLDGMYDYQPGTGVACPIVAFAGQDDEYVYREEISGWSMHAGGGFDLRILPGDHFFMDHPKNRIALLKSIEEELKPYL